MQDITQAIDPRDGVFIGGETPPPQFQTNEQHRAMGADGSTCTDRLIWKDIKDLFGGGKSIVRPQYRGGGSA